MSYQQATMRRPAVRIVACQCCRDLRGVKRGNLTVIGLHRAHDHRGFGARWVVQCTCGAYDIRRTRTLVGRENMDDMCGFCRHDRVEFKRRFHVDNGRYPDFYEHPPIQPRKGV